jgi:hypothetical protein
MFFFFFFFFFKKLFISFSGTFLFSSFLYKSRIIFLLVLWAHYKMTEVRRDNITNEHWYNYLQTQGVIVSEIEKQTR